MLRSLMVRFYVQTWRSRGILIVALINCKSYCLPLRWQVLNDRNLTATIMCPFGYHSWSNSRDLRRLFAWGLRIKFPAGNRNVSWWKTLLHFCCASGRRLFPGESIVAMKFVILSRYWSFHCKIFYCQNMFPSGCCLSQIIVHGNRIWWVCISN